MLPTDLTTLASLCGGMWTASIGGSLLLAMFLAGLMSGVTHCALMCGPLVLAQVGALPISTCARTRLVAGARLPYHVGRLMTYTALGALSGFAGKGLVHWFSVGAGYVVLWLIAAAAVMMWLAVWPRRTGTAGLLSQAIARRVRAMFAPGWRNGLALGAILGLLPCGMIYAALLVAASSASPLAGGAAMFAFGLGTVPSLVSIGTVGRAIGLKFPAWSAGVPMAINAMLLVLLAWRAWSVS